MVPILPQEEEEEELHDEASPRQEAAIGEHNMVDVGHFLSPNNNVVATDCNNGHSNKHDDDDKEERWKFLSSSKTNEKNKDNELQLLETISDLLNYVESAPWKEEQVFLVAKISELQNRVDFLETKISHQEGNTLATTDDDTEHRTSAGEKTLTEDTFNFFITAPIKSKPFLVGLLTWVLQIIVFTLLGLNLLDFEDTNNPFGIPANVTGEVRLTQFFAIAIAVILQNDLIVFLDQLRDGYSHRIRDVFPHATRLKFTISAFCRFITGIYHLFLMFTLIVSSDTVIDVLLNFTAVEFVSQFDDAVFFLAKTGFMGVPCAEEAIRIADTPYESPHMRTHRMRKIIHMVLFFLALISGWAVVIQQQHSGVYFCKTVFVQFGDDMIPALGTFSGLYDMEVRHGGGSIASERVVYVERRSRKAKFAYCNDAQAWTFGWIEEPTDDLDFDPCQNWKSRSSETETYDLTETVSFPWYIQDENQREIVLEPFFLACYDCEDSVEEQCLGRGTCTEAVCDCDEGFFGLRCEFLQPCPTLAVDVRFGNFPGNRGETPRSFELLIDSQGESITSYNRPIYVNTTFHPRSIIFFTGRRWVFTYIDFLPGSKGTNQTDESIQRAQLKEFKNKFHAHWSNFAVELLSGPMDIATEGDASIPAGLPWLYPKRKSSNSSGIQGAGARNVDTVLFCSFCDDKTNPCLYNGVCNNKGTCECNLGSDGSICEDPPVGNGHCDGYFNTAEFGFDGGDCCDSTCVSSEQFTCGTEGGGFIVSGYAFCHLPAKNWYLNDSPIIGEPGSRFGYNVALSSSGNVLAVTGYSSGERIHILDKDGSKWKTRMTFLPKNVTTSGVVSKLQIAEELDHVNNPISFTTVRVAVVFSTESGVAVYSVACERKCEENTEFAFAKTIDFAMASQGVHSILVNAPDKKTKFEVFKGPSLASTDAAPFASVVFDDLGDFRDLRISDDGETFAVLFNTPKLLWYIRVFRWNGTSFGQWGRNILVGDDVFIYEFSHIELALAGSGNVVAVALCNTPNRVQVFLYEEGDWIERESPDLRPITCEPVISKPSGSSLQLSSDGKTLAITERSLSSDSVVVFAWTGMSWEPFEQKLEGAPDYSLALSNGGNVLAVGSPLERIDASGLTYVYSRPMVQECPDGNSPLLMSLTIDELFNETEADWYIVHNESREILLDGLSGTELETIVLDACIGRIDGQCFEFILFRRNVEELAEFSGSYGFFSEGNALPIEEPLHEGGMTQIKIGDCGGPSGVAGACINGSSFFHVMAILKGNSHSLEWHLVDYFSKETILEDGPYQENERKVISNEACLDLDSKCFVLSLENGYPRNEAGLMVVDNPVDLFLDGAALNLMGREKIYLGSNGCCPAGTTRLHAVIKVCANATWTLKTLNGTLINRGEALFPERANIPSDCDPYGDPYEIIREDYCLDASSCYKYAFYDAWGWVAVYILPDDPWTLEGVLWGLDGIYTGNCSGIDWNDAERFRNSSVGPNYLSDGVPLSNQSSNSEQEYILPVTEGDYVSCCLEANNGDAGLYARFGDTPLYRTLDCYSDVWGSNECCTTRDAAGQNVSSLHVIVASYLPYENLTVNCSTGRDPSEFGDGSPSPVFLQADVPLHGQSSTNIDEEKLYWLENVHEGEIVTCMLQGDNGNADLKAQFDAEYEVWYRSNSLGSYEVISTRPAAVDTGLLVYVVTTSPYRDLTVICKLSHEEHNNNRW